MKKFTITIIMIILFLISTVSFAENLPVERDSLEKYELQQVGTIMMHGGPNSGAYYKIISDNGVAELVNDGTEIQGWLTFTKPGDAVVDMYMPYDGMVHVCRYHYKIVPKGSFEREYVDVFNYVNHTRNEQGLQLLEFSAELNDVCAVRAKELAKNYSHNRPDGSFFVSAITNKGSRLSENIFATTNSDGRTDLADYFSAWDAWFKGTESRENMLNTAIREMGINSYFDPVTQKRYWVQIFRG